MNNVDHCDEEWTAKGSRPKDKKVVTSGFDLAELVINMCDHYESLSPTEVNVLYEAAASFIKKARGE